MSAEHTHHSKKNLKSMNCNWLNYNPDKYRSINGLRTYPLLYELHIRMHLFIHMSNCNYMTISTNKDRCQCLKVSS